MSYKERQRQLRVMSSAEYVALGWLTGESLEAPSREEQRRRPYRKTAARRRVRVRA